MRFMRSDYLVGLPMPYISGEVQRSAQPHPERKHADTTQSTVRKREDHLYLSFCIQTVLVVRERVLIVHMRAVCLGVSRPLFAIAKAPFGHNILVFM